MDIVALLVGIPSVVEGFVKTARALVAYQGLESKYVETLEDAIYYAEKLAHLSRLIKLEAGRRFLTGNDAMGKIDTSPSVVEGHCIDESTVSTESQRILFELFQKSDSALRVAQKVIFEWAIRLDVAESSAARLLLAKVTISMSDRLIRLPDVKSRKRVFSKTRNKLSFLALGFIQVEDVVKRLKHWVAELRDILLASSNVHILTAVSQQERSGTVPSESDDLLFVAMAREREVRTHTVQHIERDLYLAGHLLEYGNDNLLIIEEGELGVCLLDRRNVSHFLEQGKVEQALGDTVRMARLFAEEHDKLGHNITASVGILPCCGYSTSSYGYHDLVFRLPSGSQAPRTLRSLLMEEPQHSLNERLDFSIKLASSVLIVHSLGLVHKDIRPDSIVVVRPALIRDSILLPQALGEPFLVSFNQSRSQGSITVPMAEGVREACNRLWKSLYQHPRHLSTRQHLPYETRDDVYSLGVCLLEVAIWKSLFSWNQEHGVFECDTSVLDFSASKYQKELEGCQTWTLVRPTLRRRDLIKFAQERVPITMGTTFRDVVVECLTFGEEAPSIKDMDERRKDNQKFLQNQTVNFVQHVLTRLRNLKLS